ncbi:enoyl-CoA hydratase-related protein [soil metagenome]
MTLVDYACADGAARITLVDAERGNPINTETVQQLLTAVRRAATDGARVIVLASTGRFFSVGGDLTAFGGADDMAGYVDDLADTLHRAVSELTRSDAVVIAAVQGMAAGAGFPLAACADVLVAADTAKFSLGYTRIGLSVDGGTSLMAHTLGLHRTLALALLNDVLTAAEAHAAGLVARVVPAEELDARVDSLVATLLAGPAASYAASKRLVRDAVEPAPEGRLRQEALAIRSLAGGADGREGVAAFLEKRTPEFGR